jgi:hypothetical protein
MPLSRLLVMLFVLLSFGIVSAEDQPNQAERTPVNGAKADSGSARAFTPDQLYGYHVQSHPGWRKPALNPDLQSTCFTLRTYVVQRDTPESDVVHPAGYTTCQPAPRFEVKVTTQAVPHESQHGDRKAPW